MTSIKKIQALFSKYEWYKQGGAVKPLTVSYPCFACLGFTMRGKRVRTNFTPFALYLHDDYFDVYFPRDMMLRIGWWYYRRELRTSGFIKTLKQRWEKNARSFFARIRAIERTSLAALSTRDLLALFHSFSKAHDALWREAVFIDAFDVTGEEIIEEELKRARATLSNSELSTLTAPITLSSLQRERAHLLNLARAAYQIARIRRAILHDTQSIIRKKFPQFVLQLEQHASRYHWIYNDYAVIRRLDWVVFLKEIRLLFLDREQWKEEEKMIAAVTRIAALKRRLVREKQLPKRFVRACTFVALLAGWRDLRKSMNQQANAVVKIFAEEFARRSHLTVHEVEYLWWWEIRHLFSRTRILKRLAHARMHGVLIVGHCAKFHFFYGKRGRIFHRYLEGRFGSGSAVQGRPAYPGIVRGIVKIILTQGDFKKMQRGDILIAPNTRPEYVPIIKIASAIVSEEGGITCHTSIVSRELHIPAIVGAQGAIHAFKDGDRVEVDATKGIVRKIA